MADPDRIFAVMTPPQLKLFRDVTGVTAPVEEMEVVFDGWSKLAVLTDDRVFLFPRRGKDAALLWSAAACEALRDLGVTLVPKVRARYESESLPLGPIVEFERCAGRPFSALLEDASLDELERALSNLGEAITTWHRVSVEALPAAVQRPARFDPKPTLTALLDPVTVDDLVAPLQLPQHATDALRALAALDDVFLHGDVWEGQFFVDDDLNITAVLDWDACGVGHPLHDLDFGEWGFEIFEHEVEFPRLRRALWSGYATARGMLPTELPTPAAVHLAFTLSDLVYFEQRERDNALDDWGARRLANCRAALTGAIDALP